MAYELGSGDPVAVCWSMRSAFQSAKACVLGSPRSASESAYLIGWFHSSGCGCPGWKTIAMLVSAGAIPVGVSRAIRFLLLSKRGQLVFQRRARAELGFGEFAGEVG